MNSLKTKLLIAAAALALPLANLKAQHSHTYAGDFNNDGFLDFGNPTTDVLQDLPARTMSQTTQSLFTDRGFGYVGSLTFTVINGDGSSPDDPYGPLSGTFVDLLLYSVDGPTADSTFGVYENVDTSVSVWTGDFLFQAENGYRYDPMAPLQFNLTEQAFYDATPSNPYGHIHGRRFAADTLGTYTITWALIGTNPNGSGTFTQSSLNNIDTSLRTFTQTWTAVPEPTTWALIGLAAGIGGACFLRRRSNRA